MMSEPLVLLPGMMCDARQFFPQVTALSKTRCVTVAPVSQADRIEDIVTSLIAALPKSFALAGTDLGGVVAMELLSRVPERITRLALITTYPMPDTPQVSAAREPQIIKARSGKFDDVVYELASACQLAMTPQKFEHRSLLSDMASSLGKEVFVRQARAMQRRKDHQGTLRRCKVPAIVVCGEQSADALKKRHQFMAGLLHNAEYREIAGSAAMPTLENPEGVIRALEDWLELPLVLR